MVPIVTESTFKRTVTPDAPLLARDCDLVTHIENPGSLPVAVRVVVGFEDMVEYVLQPGQERPFIDDGPFPMVAFQYNGVRVIADGDVVLTCALCDLTSRRALVDCRELAEARPRSPG
jgi:hypothetical protein